MDGEPSRRSLSPCRCQGCLSPTRPNAVHTTHSTDSTTACHGSNDQPSAPAERKTRTAHHRVNARSPRLIPTPPNKTPKRVLAEGAPLRIGAGPPKGAPRESRRTRGNEPAGSRCEKFFGFFLDGIAALWVVDGGGRPRRPLGDFQFSDYLMDALPRQIKLISNLPERPAFAAHYFDFFVPSSVGCWPWLERTPLPICDFFQTGDAGGSKLTLAISLTNVSGPSSKIDFLIFEFLNMCRWNFRIVFPTDVLLECSDVNVEFCGVVHAANSSEHTFGCKAIPMGKIKKSKNYTC